jgi:AraC-like DNA-binding protein
MTNSSIKVLDLSPRPELARLGISYRAFDERAPGPVRRLESVGAAPVMVVSLGEQAVSIGLPNERGRVASAFCVGIGSPALVSEHRGALRCIEVSAPALLAERLWPGLSSHGKALDAGELWPMPSADLVSRASERRDFAGAAAFLDAAISAALGRREAAPDAVALTIWDALVTSRGRVRTGQLAASIGVSERHAIMKFRSAAGVTPKTAARRLRFMEARRRLFVGVESLAEIALACGYADQSHLTREFGLFAGEPPARSRAS